MKIGNLVAAVLFAIVEVYSVLNELDVLLGGKCGYSVFILHPLHF